MADIDKALPNVETEIKVPGDEEVLEMEKETIEDVIEPYLIQQGYLMRTPRGRVATAKAHRHLGLPELDH